MEKSMFFNSVNGDRRYKAEEFADYFNKFIGNGVFPNPSTNCQVLSNNDMTIRISPGSAWINGYMYTNTGDMNHVIEPADSVLNRIDRVVLRWDKLERKIYSCVKVGEYSSNPKPKALQRNVDAYELCLANVKVSAGATTITQANITDTRLNNALCGIVHGVVEQVDTTTLFNQYTEGFKFRQEEFERDFQAWFETVQNTLGEDAAGNLLNLINGTRDDLETHKAEYANFKNNIEAIDYNEDKLFLKIDGEWVEFKSGSQYPVGNVSNLSATVGDGSVTIKWSDPPIVMGEDGQGNPIVIAEWAGTQLRRKRSSYPSSELDGELVTDNKIKNQYLSTGYTDVGLNNHEEYFYMLFPYTTDGIFTVDSANRISATPSPYDDLTDAPGSKNLISGTMEEGFFGEVSSSDLITGDALASQVGISQGTSQHSTAGWLKFAYKGKIQFVAKKPIRHSISYDAINTAKCVYGDSGDKTIEIGGLTYKVRLLRALEPSNDPKTVASANDGVINHYSEWNRLMCQIHEQAINKSWDYPANVESDIGILEHSLGNGNQGMYNDADLVVKGEDGRYSWCQEMSTSTSYRLYRGGGGVSYSNYSTSSFAYSIHGWRPCLELVP